MTKHADLKAKSTAVLVALFLVWASPLRGATRQSVFVLAPTWVYDFSPLDVPGAPQGINNNNEIVGNSNSSPVSRIFVLSGGVLTQLEWPGRDSIIASDINDSGTIVGTFQLPFLTHAFRYSAGTFSEVPFPPRFPHGWLLRDVNVGGINNQGQIAGWLRLENLDSGAFASLGFLDGAYFADILSDVNDAGHVVGTDLRLSPDGIYRGFLLAAGTTTPIAYPGAAQTDPDAVNNLDTVVGHYVYPIDTSRSHAFVWANGKSVSINYPGAEGTQVRGINDAGIIVGSYQEVGLAHGFFGIPRSPVNVLVNGADGPLTIDRTQPLRVDLAFDAPPSGALGPAEVYIAVVTPTGALWLDQTGALVATPTRAFAGTLHEFGPSPLFDLPNAAAFPPGTYTWFLVVDDDTNGVPDGVFYDVAEVTIQ